VFDVTIATEVAPLMSEKIWPKRNRDSER